MEKNKSQACEELKESRIIDIEDNSDDEDEMEVKVKPRITVRRPQLFSKNTPGELRDVLEKVEKDCGIQGNIIKNQDLVLISKNDNYINQKNLSSNDSSSITKASDSGVCSNNSDNLVSSFGASSDN